MVKPFIRTHEEVPHLQKRAVYACLAAGCFTAAAGAVCYLENNALSTTRLTYRSSGLPATFDGFRIAQVADLHDKCFGAGQSRLLAALRGVRPDCIVMTGDLIDRRRRESGAAWEFVRGAAQIAPLYFVTGNHENWSGKAPAVLRALTQAGVHVLDDRCETIARAGDSIRIAGVSDETCQTAENRQDGRDRLFPTLHELLEGDPRFTILLAHHPERLATYAQAGVPLVFCGHAHGGQFRLPGIGGLYAPGQGVLPKYTAGLHTAGSTTMIVSRGLGNSLFPLRLHNPPELVLVTLASGALGDAPA